jgi:serine/threonine-protein kinase
VTAGEREVHDGRHQRLRALFDAADAMPPGERAAWLRTQAPDDPALADEVLALLATADDDATLAAPPAELLRDAFSAADRAVDGDDVTDAVTHSRQAPGADATGVSDGMVGRRIGPYRLVRLLGTGGMGAVYEAVRDDAQFTMRVAIKLLRRGADSALAVRRFRYERQILAQLRHPHIAALLDGGVTDDGQPYFALEYVEGQPITRWSDAHRLGVADRVRLLLQVCGAVQHAHGQLVVHRDLKPANILVSDDGQVHLLDFGIARLLREDGGEDQLPATEGAGRVLTPDYASPEQYLGLPAQPASDIHALGVIACELLGGQRPFRLSGLPWPEAQHTVSTAPRPAPSLLVRSADPSRYGAARIATVERQLRGDLDAIVQQAMHADPSRRYPTVDALAADLQAVLDGRPVRARRDGAAYRLRTFVRRRPIETVAALVVALTLAAGTIVSIRAARRAERERQRTAAVNTFLQRMLASADPDAGGRDVTVRAVLEQATRDLAGGSLAPDIEADLRYTIGSTYYGLGVWDSAAAVARDAFDLHVRLYGRADPRTARVLALRAAAVEGLGDFAQAESLITSAVAMHRRAPRPDPRLLAEALDHQARIASTQGRPEEAERMLTEAAALLRAAPDSAARAALATVLANLAVERTYRGRTDEAESLQREAVEIERAVSGTATTRFAEMERGLADLLEGRGAYGEADSLLRHALGVLDARLGPTHTLTLRARANAARLRLRAGDPAGAVALADSVIVHIGGALPENDVTAASVLQFQGAALDSLGRLEEAERALRRAWALRRQSLPAGHWAIASAEATVGAHLLLARRYADAEPLLRRGYDGVVATHGPDAPYSTAIARRLAMLYDASGRAFLSVEWRRRAGDTVGSTAGPGGAPSRRR